MTLSNFSFPSRAQSERGITRTDILCLGGALTLLVGVSLPLLGGLPLRENRVVCATNLQIMGVALQSWANDHGDNLPWVIPVGDGGTYASEFAYEHWSALSNHLTSVQTLLCPATPRKAAQSFTGLRNANVGFFVGSDADLRQPSTMVSGDFDILGYESANCSFVGKAIVASFNGQFGQPTSYTATWSKTNHIERGNILTADGAVRQVDTLGLKELLSRSRDTGYNSHSLMPR